MKVETLVSRYKNLGYSPIGGDRDEEVAAIVKWIWNTYGYFCYVGYMHMHIQGKGQAFYGIHVSQTGTPHSHSVMTGNYFANPYDALFDSVRDLYPHLKFMGEVIKVHNKN